MRVNGNGSGSGSLGDGDHTSPSGDAANGSSESLELDRRDFLKLIGSSVSAAAAAGCDPMAENQGGQGNALHIDGSLPIDFSFNAVRREDFVNLRFDFVNLVPDKHHRSLQRKTAGKPTFVIVNFPSQHVFEPAFIETEIAQPDALPDDTEAPIGSRLSGASRVAFAVPDNFESVSFTLEGLLDLVGRLETHVARNATAPGQNQVVPAAPLTQLSSGFGGPSSRTSKLLRRQRGAAAKRHWLKISDPQPVALPPAEEVTSPPAEPFNHETALELPYRLLLSPNRQSAWGHAVTPVLGSSGRYELWHSRLGVRSADGGVDENDASLRKVRALWSRDPSFDPADPDKAEPDAGTDDQVFPEAGGEVIEKETLAFRHRSQIVHLSSNFEALSGSGDDPLPRPIDVNRLMLSALGGWLDVRGNWPDTTLNIGGALEEWEQRATLGRDHFVKVVEKGLLYPFGHVAKRITISERKFKTGEGDDHAQVAYLRQRVFIFVSEPDKTYVTGRDESSDQLPQQLRQLPFVAIKVTTVTTPSLDVVDTTSVDPFVPRVGGTYVAGPPERFEGGQPYRFGFEAMDFEGNIVSFTAPVVWVPAQRDETVGVDLPPATLDIADVDALYTSELTDEERTSLLSGQRFAYAPANRTDDTVHETHSISFAGAPLPAGPSDELKRAYPLYVPLLAQVELAVEAVRQVSGRTIGSVMPYVYHEAYVVNAFDTTANKGELVLTLRDDALPPNVSFNKQSDRSGGFVSPNMRVISLSRKIGPISGKKGEDAKAVEGKFEPKDFFADLDEESLPMLFGVLRLTDILKATDLEQAPKYLTQIVTGAMGVIADLELLANSLQSVSVDVSSALPSLNPLLDDLEIAFDSEAPDQAEAAERIADDIEAVVGDLGNLASFLSGVAISPPALKLDLVARAQKLADSLNGAVTQLLQMIQNLAQGLDLPKEIRTRMEWRGKVRTWANVEDDGQAATDVFGKFFVPFDPNNRGENEDLPDADALLLAIEILAKADGESELNVKCSLEHFKINLFGENLPFLTLRFDLLEFIAQNGKKPDVRLLFSEEGGIEFRGPLKFIEKLKQFIPIDGFSDPPNLDVDASGIRAGFTLALPNVAVGVLSLENINLSAGLRIPFIGEPLTFSFAFSSRENPFNLTVSLLGGGGFFGLELTPKGVRMLEAALEAGARISIDFGVASGSISAMIGIYFRIEQITSNTNKLLLTGYFKLHGQVDVLGLITASITLTLELTYQAEPVNKLYGRATLEIEIDIAFFSASVTITAERRFAGSNGDPTFHQIMAPEGSYRPWNEYLEAFAA